MLNMLEAEYKKCKQVKGFAKEAETYAKNLKYFRHDMVQALNWLEEEVLQYKIDTSDDPIKAKKIEDYEAKKEVAFALKAVKRSLDEWKDNLEKLEKLEKEAGLSKANIKKLENIKSDFVKLKKGVKVKLESGLVKLEKQLDEDLDEITKFEKTIKDIPDANREPDKLYESRTKYILKAQPRLSSKQKKFNDLAPNQLTKKALTKVKKECDGILKEMNKQCELSVKESAEKNTKEAIAYWQAATKQLQKLQNTVKVYTEIQRKFDKEIERSEGKKVITDYIERLVKLEEVGLSEFDKALDKINKLAAENKKAEKAAK